MKFKTKWYEIPLHILLTGILLIIITGLMLYGYVSQELIGYKK